VSSINKWRRQHGPLDGKIFQHLGKYMQLDPMLIAQYEKGLDGMEFDPHAGKATIRPRALVRSENFPHMQCIIGFSMI
jgi:hypothetical protein